MKLLSKDRPFDVWLKAIDILYEAVAHTLGPNGANTAVVYGNRIDANAKFNIINDGKAIIDNLTSDEAVVACALQTLKESVLSTNNNAGDGTTSTIVMLHDLLHNMKEHFDVENDSIKLCSMVRRVKKDLLTLLPKIVESVSINDVYSIATTSLGSDEYSYLFDDAFRFVGENGKVLLERTVSNQCFVEKLDGVSFDRVGLVPDILLDDIGTINKVVDAKAIILDGDINNFNQISKFLLTSKSMDNIVMFFTKMSQEVFQVLLQNIIKNELPIIPVSLDGYGQEKVRYIKLLESIIGHEAIKVSSFSGLQDFSESIHFIFNSDAMMVQPLDLEDFEKTKDELKLTISSKTAIIKVGAGNSVLQEEFFKRFEDAVYSVSNSLKFGRCLGGGVSYVNLSNLFYNESDSAISEWLKMSMCCIYKLLLENCGLHYNQDSNDYFLPVFNASKDCWCLDSNVQVFDSYKVIEQVISNSFDMLYSILSVKAFIFDPQR